MAKKYLAGFLEECSGNGLPFLQQAAGGNPPLVMAKISGMWATLGSGCRLSYVTVNVNGAGLTCNLYCDNELVLSRADFANKVEYEIDGWMHGFVVNTVKEIYFTYVYPVGASFQSTPADNYYLAPFCIEYQVGTVGITADSQVLPNLPILCTEGYNYQLDYSADDPTSLTFGVSPGAGAGLEPCPGDGTFSRYIRSLNGQTANDQGEINLTTPSAECVTVDSGYVNKQGQVALNSHCAPCCRCNDYKDTSDYTRGYVAEYAKSVNKFNELIAKYNSIVSAFNSRISCCSTSDSFTPRFRLWPQQNFKLQIQAMAENNTSKRIRMNSVKLVSYVTTAYAISAVDETGATYSMLAGQPIASIPISNASYLYFKNLNPTSNGLNFGVVSQGKIETSVELTGLPIDSCGSTGEHPNDVSPCTGYTMLTAGVLLVDPVFRKIVNLLGTPVNVNVQLSLSYVGSAPGADPCSGIGERYIANLINKTVAISPNKSSVNPCPSAKGSYLTIDESNNISIKFSDSMHGDGELAITYKRLTDDGWVDAGTGTAAVAGTGQSEFSLGGIDAGLSSGSYKITAKYTSPATGGLVTKCKAVDASDDEVDIPASSFELGASFTI